MKSTILSFGYPNAQGSKSLSRMEPLTEIMEALIHYLLLNAQTPHQEAKPWAIF